MVSNFHSSKGTNLLVYHNRVGGRIGDHWMMWKRGTNPWETGRIRLKEVQHMKRSTSWELSKGHWGEKHTIEEALDYCIFFWIFDILTELTTDNWQLGNMVQRNQLINECGNEEECDWMVMKFFYSNLADLFKEATESGTVQRSSTEGLLRTTKSMYKRGHLEGEFREWRGEPNKEGSI